MPKASDILAIAQAELGYTENPRGSNRTKYGKWFKLDGNPWCMMFVQQRPRNYDVIKVAVRPPMIWKTRKTK